MNSVPKIVLDRLKAGATAEGHPEADLLTAFAERSLPERERSSVLEHLSRCAECRDVVALALPPIDIAAPTPVPVRGRWFGWPALRWGLVAAGAVVVVSVGLVEYQRPAADMAKYTAPVRPQAAAGEPRSEAAPAPAAAPALTRPDHAVDQPQEKNASGGAAGLIADTKHDVASLRPPNRIPVFRGNSLNGNAVSGPHGPSQWQQNNSSNTQSQAFAIAPPPAPAAETAPRIGSASQTVEVSSAAPVMQDEARSEVSADRLERQDVPVGKAKAASQDAGATVGGPLQKPASPVTLTPMARTSLASAVSPPPNWTISATGGLQRSLDHGSTWQDVNVVATEPAVGANFASFEVVVKNSRAREKDKEEEGKGALKKQTTGPVFRAVAAVGADVWAGGQGGILYHSKDSGDHWARVVPNVAGSFLTGDVVGVEFSDPQHGKITTAVPEVWNTADGGESWQKQ